MVIRAAAMAISLALLAWSHVAYAQPVIERPVTDAAGVLGAATIAAIEARLHAHHEAGHAQIALLLVPSLEGAPIADYALRAAERWRGGSEPRDDGALFVLAVEDREMRIEVGYGLEEAIPDAAAMRILDALVPHLREQRFDLAAWTVADALVARTGGASERFPEALATARAPTPEPPRRPRQEYTIPAGDIHAPDPETVRAERAEDQRATRTGLGLVAFVVLASVLVFAYLWRQSSVEYDHDGQRIERPFGDIVEDVADAIRGFGASGGGGDGAPSPRSPHDAHDAMLRHAEAHRRAMESHRSHRREHHDHGSSSSGGGSKHRSYSGGGGGFGGGGASKRW